jgi:hypothetical protein
VKSTKHINLLTIERRKCTHLFLCRDAGVKQMYVDVNMKNFHYRQKTTRRFWTAGEAVRGRQVTRVQMPLNVKVASLRKIK